MWRYYWDLVKALPGLLIDAADSVSNVVLLIGLGGIAVLTVFNQPIGSRFSDQWLGFSPLWALVPIGVLAVFGLAKENYTQVVTLTKQRDDALSRAGALTTSMPRNRESLIRTITALEQRASEAVSRKWVEDHFRQQHPEMVEDSRMVREAKLRVLEAFNAYNAADDAFETEMRIAGKTFEMQLFLYQAGIQVQVDAAKLGEDDEELTEEATQAIQQKIRELTREVLGKLDRGQLYMPVIHDR